MINDVLSEIIKSEGQAEDIVATAREKAGNILAEVDDECAKMQAENKERMKTLREQIQTESEKRAESEYNLIVEESKQTCAKMIEEKGALVDKAGEYIFGRILDGNF